MSTRKLYTPSSRHDDGTNVYCAPFCLMAITGKTPEQAYRSIRKATNRYHGRAIKGMPMADIVRTFKHCGYNMEFMHKLRDKTPTLAQWVRERTAEERRQTFLIASTTHVFIVSGNTFIDTRSKGQVKIDDAPHRRTRIESYFRITGK